MNKKDYVIVSRRRVLAGTGALILGFASMSRLLAQQPELPGAAPNARRFRRSRTLQPHQHSEDG